MHKNYQYTREKERDLKTFHLSLNSNVWKLWGVIYSLGAFIILVPSLATFQERGQEILNGHFFSKTSSLTLTFDHVTCISIRVIYSLGVSIVPSLETFKQRGCRVKRYWMDIIYTKTSSLTLTFEHVTWNLLSRSIHYTKFENFQAKGSKYIEQPSLGLQSCKTICLLFFKGGIKSLKISFKIKCSIILSLYFSSNALWLMIKNTRSRLLVPFFY